MNQIILSAILFLISCISNAQKNRNHSSFVEDFNGSTFKNFRYGSTGNKADFKWKPGVNSPTEPGTKILSLR